MLTASKDCNLDWKVQCTQYHNISEDDIDVLFRSKRRSIECTKNMNALISILKHFSHKVSSLEFM